LMATQLVLGGVVLDVVKKDIKNVHLSVHPPAGRVRIAAPFRMSTDTIRIFAIAKLDWIRRQQRKLQEQERETPREYIDRESHWIWGRRRLLKVLESSGRAEVTLGARVMTLRVRPAMSPASREATVEEWYRHQLRAAAAPMIEAWQRRIGVRAGRLFIQRMRTKWGACNPRSGNIRLNTELAKKPIECLEYIVVHELIHLLEPSHNQRFIALMDRWLPTWRHRRAALNRLPVRHEEWGY
jgi:predicted metal-dependent hydrolase